MTSVWWLRRDLRLADNPALLAAAAEGADAVVALFVVDPALWGPAGPVRRAYLQASLRALDAALGGALLVLAGDPEAVVPRVAATAGATGVHVAADFGPYGARRDLAVERALAANGRRLVRTGSPYAVAPPRLRTAGGQPFRVFTPFYRAWCAHGWRAPAADPSASLRFVRPPGDSDWPPRKDVPGVRLPAAGEQAALARWADFRGGGLAGYAQLRDRADLAGTSALSAALRWGEIHPRTLLADLGDQRGHERFRAELAWREFHAHVLAAEPRSAREDLRPEMGRMEYARGPDADAAFAAWAEGRTGFPFVDAGMRQLRREGWMHNRVRMVVASFLVKDLHQSWQRGAREFMRWLRDGDLASNQLSWQWVAGSGTDAAPYFRVFNPVLQGRRHDPEGDYVRRYVPELGDVPGSAVHEPWLLPGGVPPGYPERVVDHAAEREEALARFDAVRRREPRASG
ncbi:MAG TPA: deoxyribodipyrimidine photo-lyase [Actinomycetes bacterium]|nr:deoxyribodipyrimidine photo-lyase [Actinomycetes bacterium]